MKDCLFLQKEEQSLRAQVSQEQLEKDQLKNDIDQQAKAAEKQMQTMAAVSEQALQDARKEHEKALAQVARKQQAALEAANSMLVNTEVQSNPSWTTSMGNMFANRAVSHTPVTNSQP